MHGWLKTGGIDLLLTAGSLVTAEARSAPGSFGIPRRWCQDQSSVSHDSAIRALC